MKNTTMIVTAIWVGMLVTDAMQGRAVWAGVDAGFAALNLLLFGRDLRA